MKKLLLLCLALALAGCTGTPANAPANPFPPAGVVQPTSVPEQSPAPTIQELTPVPAITVDQTPSAQGSSQSFSDDKLGITFSYPSDWTLLTRDPDAMPGVALRGPAVGQGTEPIIFAITIDVLSVKGESVASVVDSQLAQVPKNLQGGINRTPLKVGGAPAEQVTGLPSQSGAVETFVEGQGNVLLVILQPYDPSNKLLAPYLPAARQAYDMVLSTWSWLR